MMLIIIRQETKRNNEPMDVLSRHTDLAGALFPY